MATATTTLGKTLKQARELKRISLRELEIQSGISNAYLSQLENDKIKKPSANTLYKLSDLYNIDFDDLMVLAGIVEKKREENKPVGHFAFSSENLSEEEEKELIEYLKYLRYKKKDDK